jgi:hypothetical protein
MNIEPYYYNCSPEYIDSIDNHLRAGIEEVIEQLPKRQTQSEINSDLFWLLTNSSWNYDTSPTGVANGCPKDFKLNKTINEIRISNDRSHCLTSSTLNTKWHSDFAKTFGYRLVQVEAQFGKVEAMFKDFCGFRMAYAERRLALGIEIVLCDPNRYFAHRRKAIGGMASFGIARDTLTSIGLDCPIWLVGIKER